MAETKKKVNPTELDYILKLKILCAKLSRTPIQTEFVKAGMGTGNTIKSIFGNWDNFVKVAKLEKDPVIEYPIDDDMERLRIIMMEFNMDPTISRGEKYFDSLSRLLFCNILATKYPDLKEEVVVKKSYKVGEEINKIRVYKFLKCSSRQTVYHNLRPNGLNTIKGYKDYENKYKVMLSGFNNDFKYIRMKELQKVRDESQEEMVQLMTKILKEY